ncbi:MAG: hypothetical protein OCD76_15550 [Reichenbachiella sp.]
MTNSPVTINLDVLRNERFQDDFAQKFCKTFIPKVEEFRIDFSKYFEQQNTAKLKDIIHTIVASLNFLEMKPFVDILYQYTEIDMTDDTQSNAYTTLVSNHCIGLIEELKKFLA